MYKSPQFNFHRCVPYVHVFLLYSVSQYTVLGAEPVISSGEIHYPQGNNVTIYDDLGDFAEIFKIVEDEITLQEESDAYANDPTICGWTKKLKRWFLKRIKNMLQDCCELSQSSNLDECAYSVAKFKRQLDEVYDTGDIEVIVTDFDKIIPKEKNINTFVNFKKRVIYYSKHKKARPSSTNGGERNNFLAKDFEDKDDIPTGAIIGGVEIFCGCLIAVLPIPGCKWLGRLIIGDGMSRIISAGVEEHDRNQACAGYQSPRQAGL